MYRSLLHFCSCLLVAEVCYGYAGTWWHLSLFLNTHELGFAYATVSSAASIAQVRRCASESCLSYAHACLQVTSRPLLVYSSAPGSTAPLCGTACPSSLVAALPPVGMRRSS